MDVSFRPFVRWPQQSYPRHRNAYKMSIPQELPSLAVYAETLAVPGTPDVHLRLSGIDDASEVFEVVEANREFLSYQWWTRSVRTPDDAYGYVQKGVNHDSNISMQYRIADGQPQEGVRGAILGTITVYEHNLFEHTARQGIASRATRRIIEYAQDTLGIKRVEAQIDVANRPSERLAQKLGFTITGIPEAFAVPTEESAEPELRTVSIWSKEEL